MYCPILTSGPHVRAVKLPDLTTEEYITTWTSSFLPYFLLIRGGLLMTEYDFSPEAHQRHLANMQRISRWVDHTEQYRSQSAFPTPDAVVDSRKGTSSTRRIPPPLNLPAHDQRMPFYPPNPPHSVSSSQYFSYATSPGSPGPMPTPMHQHRLKSPPPSYGHGTMSPLSPLSYDSHPQSPGFSHGHGTPISPPPFNQYPVMPPGYVIVSSGRSNTRKKSSSSRRYSKSAPLIYYHL